ncbi:allantoicase [Kwoniella mangroviensis CBS 8507]|uniref:allantoicase n=1 Tax=Kwoniella mangroviensis CBS 8507 TaxID=1296122 RepID=UPI00080D126F|nr:allantoicase [Kwoniella mangroviensis CBS 8507]OCF64300.1 allantoicase [Kwoniella mangroviensis CBS 8507]
MSYTPKQIDLETFDSKIRSSYVEVSSASLGGKVVACSDDFFASRHNLLKPNPSISMKGQFGPNGALYDGWESRRHNPSFDWVIIQLATPSTSVSYVDIDTSHFSGNEAPQSQIFALSQTELSKTATKKISPNTRGWSEILPVVDLGPNSRHIFELGNDGNQGKWGWLMVRMIPDGGMARFRAFGTPTPPALPITLQPDYRSTEPIDLVSPLIGGSIVSCSDANFSPPQNLLLPGRGIDMSDGWETRRSQHQRGKYSPEGPLAGQERKEWVIIKMGVEGVIGWVEVDTAFHPGNYPVACTIEATLSEKGSDLSQAEWTQIVSKKPLGPHRQHFFDVEKSIGEGRVWSHVRYTVYPDGGSKRLRVYGYPLSPSASLTPSASAKLNLPVLPLTYEAFEPYGQVIQGYSFPSSAPKGINVTVANQGTAAKFHRLGKIEETYPEGVGKPGGSFVGCVKAQSRLEVRNGAKMKVELLERHPYTTQAFIPLGRPANSPPPGAFIVVVALNGADDKPDLKTVRAFLATAAQGVSFDAGIWHHSLFTIGGDLEYAVIERGTPDPSSLAYVEKISPSLDTYLQIPPFPPTSLPPGTIETAHIPHPAPVHTHTQNNGHDHLKSNGHPAGSGFLSSILHHGSSSTHASNSSILDPVLITPDNFSKYGSIISSSPSSTHKDSESSPDGKTTKHNCLAPIISTYPSESGAITGISVFRATRKVGLERGRVFDVRYMERHKYTSQAFLPMGKAEWSGQSEEALDEGGEFLVIVADNGPDDKPDPKTLQSFILPPNMGLSYAPGVWHHPVLILDSTIDLACVETQISTGLHGETDDRDCELLSWEGQKVFGRVAVPSL